MCGLRWKQREIRSTRELALTDNGRAWLTADWKSGEGGSCKGYRWPMLRAAQLWYEVYSSCGGGGLWSDVLYRRHPLNFQYPVHAEPLVFLTSLWCPLTVSLCLGWPWSCRTAPPRPCATCARAGPVPALFHLQHEGTLHRLGSSRCWTQPRLINAGTQKYVHRLTHPPVTNTSVNGRLGQ